MNLPPGISAITSEQAATRLLSAYKGMVTIHRRPKSGSVPCFGGCGKRIAANKALCLACATAAEAAQLATAQSPDNPAGGTTQPTAETDTPTGGG